MRYSKHSAVVVVKTSTCAQVSSLEVLSAFNLDKMESWQKSKLIKIYKTCYK